MVYYVVPAYIVCAVDEFIQFLLRRLVKRRTVMAQGSYIVYLTVIKPRLHIHEHITHILTGMRLTVSADNIIRTVGTHHFLYLAPDRHSFSYSSSDINHILSLITAGKTRYVPSSHR